MWPRRGRLVVAVLSCVFLGVLCSLAIAFAVIVREHRRTSASYIMERFAAIDREGPMLVERVRWLGVEQWTVYRQPIRADGSVREDLSRLPRVQLPSRVATPADGPGHGLTTLAYGWPLTCVKWEEVSLLSWEPRPNRPGQEFLTGRSTFRGAWNILIARTPPRWFYLPHIPIWPGLILDTAFFTALALGLVRGPALVRRWLRRWRGACPRCGYDLRGAREVCPECGRSIS